MLETAPADTRPVVATAEQTSASDGLQATSETSGWGSGNWGTRP